MNITFTIPDEQVQKLVDAVVYYWPVPVDESSGKPLYTSEQWTKEWYRQHMIETVRNHLRELSRKESDKSISDVTISA
ncbi:MAG: hypothetical protein A2Y07_01300 [Planctomycetes bacterium GWF2_50_10]|nr:MAG: hypothetical protein A2Y07_01300 [Planctomycetes bacterium GWF2_50_10]